jgi:hypothetical protein
MRLLYTLVITFTLCGLWVAGCATNHDAELQHQVQSIHRGHYLLSATNDAPGSFYQLGVYVIGPGDTLAKIARQFQVSVSDIVAINSGLVPNRLVIGQRVRIYERRRE